jgi:uncharacterized coiled-coil protein SlyX
MTCVSSKFSGLLVTEEVADEHGKVVRLEGSEEKLAELQEMVEQLEEFADNHSAQVKHEVEEMMLQDMEKFSTSLEMAPSCVNFEVMKSQYIAEAEMRFRTGCVQRQNDIEIYISTKMRKVLDELTSSLAAQFNKVREERLIFLEGIREQVRAKAEQELVIVQTQFVQQADAEITGLHDDEIGDFVQHLITKTDDYSEAAKTAFRQKFTSDEWKHIADCESQLNRRLIIPLKEKLQEATQRQQNIDRTQFSQLAEQKKELEKQLTNVETALQAERAARQQDVTAFQASKDQAVTDAKTAGRAEKIVELEEVKRQFDTRIEQLKGELQSKDAVIQQKNNDLTAKENEITKQQEKLKQMQAKLRLSLAYRRSPDESDYPTETIWDFCISGLTLSQLDSVKLENGNRLYCGGPYSHLCFQGNSQTLGRDTLPVTVVKGNTLFFRYVVSSMPYYATDSCSDICDSCSGYERYSLFAVEKVSPDAWGGCWILKNIGLQNPRYLRAVGGKIACDGQDASNASKFSLRF